jgi:hypothetical protein
MINTSLPPRATQLQDSGTPFGSQANHHETLARGRLTPHVTPGRPVPIRFCSSLASLANLQE